MANKVMLIGDTIIDITSTGRAIGLSAETPTITMQLHETTRSRGGAAFVSSNMHALNCEHTFISNESVWGKPARTKHRFWADGYKLFQVNTGDNLPLGERQEDALIAYDPPKYGILVFSDYRHGLLTERVIRTLISKAKDANCLIFVDSQVSKAESNHGLYFDADVMFVNEREEQYVPAGFDKHGVVVVKMGADGCRCYGRLGVHRFAGMKVDVVDTCGAGDAFLAAFVAAYDKGPAVALFRANRWAAEKCTLHGMAVPEGKLCS